MSYPQYPAQQQPYYPPQQQPYYPAQAPQYPPQAQAPGYYAPPAQYAAPPPPPPQSASIDDFFDQPAASGKSISFDNKPPGTSYVGMVARTLTRADIVPQTEMRTKNLATHPDGRQKWTMVVPLLVQPSAEFPDGRAAWYCKHNEKPELERAMEAAGLKPGTPPEQGAVITITYTHDRPVPGLNPQKVKQITYRRPEGANPTAVAAPIPGVQDPAPQPASAPQFQQVEYPPFQQPQQVPFQQPQYAPPGPAPEPVPYAPLPAPAPVPPPAAMNPQPAMQQQQQPAVPWEPQYATGQPPYGQPAPAPQPAPMPSPPQGQVADLTQDQLALLAKLTGQG